MDTATIASLREEFSTAQAGAHRLITDAAVAKRDLTGEESAENDRRFARMEQIKKQFDDDRKFAELSLANGNAVLPKDPAGKAELDQAEKRATFHRADGSFDLDKFKAGMTHFARTGETRQLFTVTTSTGTGAYLPKEVLQPVTVRRLSNAFRAVLAAKGFEPISTDSLAAFSLPVADDTANDGADMAEDAGAVELDPDNTGAIALSPTVYTSKQFWYSNTMVMAGGFDIVAFTLPLAGKRLDKRQETIWTTRLLAVAPVGKTLASPTAMTYQELLDWEHSLAPAYRNDACFIASDSLYRTLRGMVDSNLRPIMDQNPQDTFQVTVHGKPLVVSDKLQTVAANHALGAFISADAIKIVDCTNARLVRYVNVPSKPDQIGFELFQNADCGFVAKGASVLRSAVS